VSEIIHEPSPDIIDDGSSSYPDWKEYEKAVKAGEEEEVPEVKKPQKAGRDYTFNVDHALDTIDLSFPNYTPSKDAVEYFIYMKLILGHDPDVSNSKAQFFMIDVIFGNVTQDMYPYAPEVNEKIRLNPKKVAIIATRFFAKSSLVTAFLPIYTAIKGEFPNFGKVLFWVSFGDAQQAGAKVQANTIRDICEDSAFCNEYFEKMRFTDEECEFLRKGEGSEKSRSFMFKVKGAAGGSVRGIRYKAERPQIISWDDAIKNEAEANSPVVMKKLRSMMYADAENALGRKGKIIIVNTPFTKSDPVYEALESGVWTPLAIPLCEKMEIGMTKEQYRGSWEDMKPFEEIYEKYEDNYYNGTLREFNQELMLRIASEEDKLVKDELIEWYSRDSLGRYLDGFNLYLTSDLTASNTTGGDYSVVMMWAVSSSGDWFMIDLSCKQQTIDEQEQTMLSMIQRWTAKTGKNITVGIEIDGQQQLNVHTFKKHQIEHKIWFTFAAQIGASPGQVGISRRRAGGDKHEQFMRVHTLFLNHKIHFPEEFKDTPDMKEVLEELKYITYTGIGSAHDDALDGISMLGIMSVLYPSTNSGFEQKPSKKAANGWFQDEVEDIEDAAWITYI